MNLFQAGDFVLRSGKRSTYRIECDALTADDWAGVAAAMSEEGLLPAFCRVVGVPRGGIPFAAALAKYASGRAFVDPVLIAEDVVTTGGSMERFRDGNELGLLPDQRQLCRGVCFLARGPCPAWVTPFLSVTQRAVFTAGVPQ